MPLSPSESTFATANRTAHIRAEYNIAAGFETTAYETARWADLIARLFRTMHLAGALLRNPSVGIRYRKYEIASPARGERDCWTSDEVRRLLESPLITGKGIYRLRRTDHVHDPEAYWRGRR